MGLNDFINRKHLIYAALIGLLFFGIFQLTKGTYYRAQQKTLVKNLQAQISILQSPVKDGHDNIAAVSEAEETLAKLTKNSRRLSLNTLEYEKDYILLESLDRHYRYRQEFSELLARIFEYNPENDLNSRSVSEYKGDFMYRLSLTQYALKQITARLKEYDKESDLAAYTKSVIEQFPPIIELIDQLIEATKNDQIKKSNGLRQQYISDMNRFRINLKPNSEQILKELEQTNQKLIAQIKI